MVRNLLLKTWVFMFQHKIQFVAIIFIIGIIVGVVMCKKTKLSVKEWVKSNIQSIFNCFILLAFVITNLFLPSFVAYNGGGMYQEYSISLNDIEGVNYYEPQVNLYDSSGVEDFFYDYNGSIVESQNGSQMSNWIECTSGQQITRNGIATNVVCYFDKDKNFIRREDSYGLETITVPEDENIAFVRLAVQPSSERIIVYGNKISAMALKGEYYDIPRLKVSDRNLINDYSIIESPDGKRWRISVDNDGIISTEDVSDIILNKDLPEDFSFYSIEGESDSNDDYLITSFGANENEQNYIYIMSHNGDVKWYKSVPNYAYNFRKIIYPDDSIRYAYQETIGSVDNTNGGFNYTKVVLMDENLNILNDDIRPIPYGSIKADAKCENHDYRILGDDHFIVTTITFAKVNDIPGIEKECYVVNAVIQEQKGGEVVYQWESIDYPELYTASILHNDYINSSKDEYADYVHLNSIDIDPITGDLLISCRSIGLIKISRSTGEILWTMGRGKCDINGIEQSQIGLYQHDARYLPDGSFTIFDNSGGKDEYSRVCRYWIDEKKKLLTDFQEFLTPYKSTAMGSATLLDEESDTYLICYGGHSSDVVFEERNFNTGKGNVIFRFNDGKKAYRVFKGVESVPAIKD